MDIPTCRICQATLDEDKTSDLISPCLCTGSMLYVHIHCLHTWRQMSVNPHSYYQCNACLYKYRFVRLHYARYITHPVTMVLVTILSSVFIVLLLAYLIKYITVLFVGFPDNDNVWVVSSHLIHSTIVFIGAIFITGFSFVCVLSGAVGGMEYSDINVILDLYNDYTKETGSESESGALKTAFMSLGYACSFMGFGIFLYCTYYFISKKCRSTLKTLSGKIVSVHHDRRRGGVQQL